MTKSVLTPQNPRWGEFVDRLAAVIYDSADESFLCDGDQGMSPEHVHRHAKGVMATMGGIDTAASLDFFKAHGGYCDCEILLNVVRD
jgi:Protein of unknown function (DUF2695)